MDTTWLQHRIIRETSRRSRKFFVERSGLSEPNGLLNLLVSQGAEPVWRQFDPDTLEVRTGVAFEAYTRFTGPLVVIS